MAELLTKPTKYSIEDSNIALLGSDVSSGDSKINSFQDLITVS